MQVSGRNSGRRNEKRGEKMMGKKRADGCKGGRGAGGGGGLVSSERDCFLMIFT